MTKQDLQQIKEVFRSELEAQLPIHFKKLFRSELEAQLPKHLGKFTEEVILPAVENIIEDKLKIELAPIKTALGVIQTRYPDKAYLDDKLNDLRGDVLAARKKDSARVDEHIQIHYHRGNLTKKDVEKLESLRDFAPLSISS